MFKWFKRIFVIAALCFFTGFIYQTISTQLDDRKYLPLGRLVDIDGFRLHLYSAGTHGPTVILDSGLGSYSLDWSLVQPSVAKFARVYSYDRAGYGWSDESPNERTCANMVEELHALLTKANVPKPYILVGHSLGGVNARLFASRYPDEVAGIVLVDSAHEDVFEKMPKMTLPSETLMLIASRLGLVRILREYFSYQSDVFALFKKLPSDIHPIRAAQVHATKITKTAYSELSNLQKSLSQLKEESSSLGNIPLIVISAMKVMPSDSIGIDQNELDDFHKVFLEFQKDLLTKSTQSTHILAEESDHSVPLHQPEIIVDAIRSIADKTKKVRQVRP